MVAAMKRLHPELADHDFLGRVVLEQAPDAQRLLDMLSTSVRATIARFNVRLLVVDSIAAVFREFGSEEMVERAKLMGRVAQQLKFIADGVNGTRVFVLVTNQVSARLDGPEARPAGIGGDVRPVPALGLSWASAVNTRLVVRRTGHKADPLPQQGNDPHAPEADQARANPNASAGKKRRSEEALEEESTRLPTSPQGVAVRELSVGFAPHLPRSEGAERCCHYVVERCGVVGITLPSLHTNVGDRM